MPTNILMPALSPTMEEGKLARWLVKEGDEISSGDVIAEIETDKATMEVEAVEEGRLGRIMVPEGTDAVKVNEVIAILLEEGESEDDIAAAPEKKEEEADPHSAPAGAPPQVEPQGGYGRGEAPPKPNGGTPPSRPAPAPAAGGRSGERIFASPLARRIAKEKGLDLAAVSGSGPHGRIVKSDVEKAEAAPQPAAAPQAGAGQEQPTPVADPAKAPVGPAQPASADAIRKLFADREFEEVPLDGMRRTIAARLSEAKQTIPHFYLRREIEIDALLALRAEMNAKGEKRGIKLSVNDYIIKACALALQQVPDCNAVWAGDRLLKLRPVDVAVAVAIEGGLLTPVIRDAHQKSLSTISSEMKDLASRARVRKLAPHEYQGGSFAISNLGMYGVDNFDAVINPPHGSILAVGRGLEKPVIREGSVTSATMMSVTLSVDHRVIDGALGAQFLEAITDYLEDPMAMLM